jgi:hypothetical protein
MSGALSGLDAWLTREPDYEPEERPQHRCEACGAFLAHWVDRRESWEHTEPCDGAEVVCSDTYTADQPGILDIIGWQHLGETFEVVYDPPCGMPGPHEPHALVIAGGDIEYRSCSKCGLEDKQVIC